MLFFFCRDNRCPTLFYSCCWLLCLIVSYLNHFKSFVLWKWRQLILRHPKAAYLIDANLRCWFLMHHFQRLIPEIHICLRGKRSTSSLIIYLSWLRVYFLCIWRGFENTWMHWGKVVCWVTCLPTIIATRGLNRILDLLFILYAFNRIDEPDFLLIAPLSILVLPIRSIHRIASFILLSIPL